MATREPAYKRAGFATEHAYTKARKQAREWSDRHSRSEGSKYEARMKPEEFRAYFDAYASNATGTTARYRRGGKHRGPSRYVRHYLVNVTKKYTQEEFDGRYTPLE